MSEDAKVCKIRKLENFESKFKWVIVGALAHQNLTNQLLSHVAKAEGFSCAYLLALKPRPCW